jgi:hypothetical protein
MKRDIQNTDEYKSRRFDTINANEAFYKEVSFR